MNLMIFLIQELFVYTKILKTKKLGLGKGGNLENAIVVDNENSK